MGFRFRKSIKIAPGIKLNIGKKGISSVSIGKRGASVNISGKGTRSTIGIPGSGLSYSSYTPHTQNNEIPSEPKKRGFFKTLFIILFWLIIGFLALAFFLSKDKSNSSKPSETETLNVADQELKPLSNETVAPTQTAEPTPIPTPEPPKQEEFTPQAEQNAHAYVPTAEDYKRLEQEKQSQKSIADSQSQDDTISIKTTLRNKSE